VVDHPFSIAHILKNALVVYYLCYGKDGEEFDVGKIIGLAIGAALLYEVAKSGDGGSGYPSGVTYMGASIDDDDWDYLPGSSQYRCRSISTGQFVSDYLCSDDIVEDSWY
jgi:hypothetical protein